MASSLLSLLGKIQRTRTPRRRYSAHPFYLVLLTLIALAIVSLPVAFLNRNNDSFDHTTLTRRGNLLAREESATLECRFVHRAKDQCAFINANCDDEQMGLLSYLHLYYCNLSDAKPVAFIVMALWLGLLFSTVGIAASDFLCVNLSTIATIFGMSESLTGVTFLAFGNGSPDVFSTFAAMGSNSGSMAVGELLGAACFITGVVAGSMAIVRPFHVARRSFVRDVSFFITAAAFSLVFLADGKLEIWECVVMVSYYVFYVITVVAWHWYFGRKRRARERDIAARAHFHIPENQELDIDAEPEDDDPVAGASRPLLLGASTEDFSSLERAEVPAWKRDNVEEDDEARDWYLAQLQGNMRISRAPPGQRGHNIGPIRPSLVGALEFRSVLSSLRRSRNYLGPINLRRYSDEPDLRRPASFHNEPASIFEHGIDLPSNRRRAVSAHEPVHHHPAAGPGLSATGAVSGPHAQQDLLYASPSSSGYPSRAQSPAPPQRSVSPSLLAPPHEYFRAVDRQQEPSDDPSFAGLGWEGPSSSTARKTPSAVVSPLAPFPAYQDSPASIRSGIPSLRLPSASAGSIRSRNDFVDDEDSEPQPPGWWPRLFLPTPHVIATTLFPTLVGWSSGNVWDKLLGIAAAPSVFTLTLTLPVVEPPDPESELPPGIDQPDGSPPEPYRDMPGPVGPEDDSSATLNGDQPEATNDRRPSRQRHDSELPCAPTVGVAGEPKPSGPKVWNRWLLAVQLVTSPLFVTWTAWVNLDSELKFRNLLFCWLFSLIAGLILLAALFLATNSSSTQLPAPARPFVAFLGFIVSISWISFLATEVVSLLKTFGVILSISDSLLGLTVFAVGNSLGDLIADITVARLGYPVMALSACFGGPMLNILIGIGVGGLYMTLHGRSKATSSVASVVSAMSGTPDKDAYHVVVSRSLLISGVTLVITLLALLICVPLNGWKLDRKLGTGLVALWTVSTICNVIVEVVTEF